MYRAQIDGVWLPLRGVQNEPEDRVRVVFDIPQSIKSRRQDEVVFLCFSAGYDAEDQESERILQSVRWR